MSLCIQPGSTLGILGGGQLGRMLAIAAKTMGYHVRVMDPDPYCPAHSVVDDCIAGSFSDINAALKMAKTCDVVTLEIEQISVDLISAVQEFTPVRPSAEAISIIQNRVRQKEWLVQQGFPVGPFAVIKSGEDCKSAIKELGGNIFLKDASGGYDGRSQLRLENCNAQMLEAAWMSLGGRPSVAERMVLLQHEISVMTARSPSGEMTAFPTARNHHEKQVLVWSVLPAQLDDELEHSAQALALDIAQAFAFEGLLAVEMFVALDGRLLVNELAPRPHNSYHASERACITSQFEQAVRAVCNLPLGDVGVVMPSAIVNLLGDLWLSGDQPRFDRALQHSGVRLHLYEKSTAREGRKMGHLSAVGETSEAAIERALAGYRALAVRYSV